MMDTRELADLQADLAAELLPDTCHILALARVSDGQGGYTETWGTATANVACRKDAVKNYEALAAAGVSPFGVWLFTLPAGTTLTSANRIQHGGAYYNVTGQDAGKSLAACIRVYAEAL
jgi:hypothetical protein